MPHPARARPTAGGPRREPAPAAQADELPEPVEAPKAPDVAPSPKPADSAAVEPAPAEEPSREGPALAEASVSAAEEADPEEAPELPRLSLDQEPVIPTSARAIEPTLASHRGWDAPRPVRSTSDIDNDPVLAGRPRLRPATPDGRGAAGWPGGALPAASFPASYYAADPDARTAVATASAPSPSPSSPSPARPRRSLLSRLFRRPGKRGDAAPAAPSVRGEPRDLAQRGDLVDRVAADRLDESPER